MEEKWCCDCDIEEAEYEYEGKLYCPSCLLDKLISDSEITTSTTTSYFVDGEYIGNDDENDSKELVDNMLDCLEITQVD